MNCYRLVAGAIVVFGSMLAVASADERATSVSNTTLSSMGFGGAAPLLDDEGLAVRGKGTSFASWGHGDFAKRGHHEKFVRHFGGFKHVGKMHNVRPTHAICKFDGGIRPR